MKLRIKTTWLLLALPTIFVGLILIILLNWHLPTRVRITLKTDRITFKVGGEHKSTILNSVGLKSIIIEKFESIKLKPESLMPSGRGKDSGAAGRHSPSSQSPLTIRQQPVVIIGKEGRRQPNVTLSEIPDDKRSVLLMDSVNTKPTSEVTLESTDDPGDLILHVYGQQSSGKITVSEPIKLAIDQCAITGVGGNMNLDEPLTLTAKLLRDSSIEFNGQQNSLILTISVPTEKAPSIFPETLIPVTSIKFERLDEQSGKVVTSLLKGSNCELTYPDYQDKIDKVTISNPDFLSIDNLQNFNIEEMTYDPKQKGISMRFQGIANKVMSGSPDFNRDHRLTAYQALWHNYKVIALFIALGWTVGATTAIYKFFKEKG